MRVYDRDKTDGFDWDEKSFLFNLMSNNNIFSIFLQSFLLFVSCSFSFIFFNYVYYPFLLTQELLFFAEAADMFL